MKSAFFLFCGMAILISCQAKFDEDAERQKIKDVLDSYITSIETENMNLYSDVMAHDQNMVNYGTSEAPIVGWESLKSLIENQNAALSQTKITRKDLVIHIGKAGTYAWATDLWDFKARIGDQAMDIPVRCSWFLEKQDGRWVIAHFHKSVRAEV